MGNVVQELGESSALKTLGSELTQPRLTGSAPHLRENEYAELKRLVKQKGLLDKQPAYYTRQILLILGLLAVSVTLLVLIDTLWLQLLNAVLLAFVFGQIGFIGHDAGHRQIVHGARNNEIVILPTTFLLGMSRTWWVDKHNKHHSNPNQLDLDPDTYIPALAFSEEQARSRRGFWRFMVKHQAYLLLPALSLEGLGLRIASAQFLIRNKAKYPLAEPLLMAFHLVAYFGLLFYLLSVWQAVLFIIVHQALFGLYTGSVFAPNHKGMLLLDEDSKMDFLRQQVLTSRNVKAHPLTDFWYGGLNYQIEHHLFPSMPRNKLREAQKIVKAFCQERSIPYHETSMVQSYREILQYLHQVGAPLRERET